MARVVKRRVDHLKTVENAASKGVNTFRKQRLERMLVDHFLREGYYNTASKLAESSNIADLTNIDVFLISKEVSQT